MELVDAIAGLRPGTPDNLPLIGPGAIEGLVLATGHYRNGILLAPLTAERDRRPPRRRAAAGTVASHPFRMSLSRIATKDDSGLGRERPDAPRPDRAAELAARGAALAAAAEAAERAAEEPR